MVKVYSVDDPETGVERAIFFNPEKKVFHFSNFEHISYDPANSEGVVSLVACFSRTHSNREFLSASQLSILKATLLDLVARPPKEMGLSAGS